MSNTQYQQSFQLIKDTQEQIREIISCQMRGAALKMLQSLFSEEVSRLCGSSFCRKNTDLCHRGGSDKGSVVLQGQRVAVKKPRIRKGDKEIHLESYDALQSFDLLCEDVMKHMLCGVSTRNYDGLLNEWEGGLGLKKSSVSKAFKMGSQQALEEINGADLSEQKFVAMMIDGVVFGNRTVIVALGITTKGKKIPIGLREGDTENSEVCGDLFASLIERGLDPAQPILFVIDGSKALKKAIRKAFGKIGHIQRCVRHKERNIISYLPRQHHMEFRRRWKRLHAYANYSDAKREYEKLVQWLSHINHAALSSLEEAEMETLTVVRLETPRLLRETLLSTNPLESVFAKVRDKSGRVKNWKSGPDQVSRWAAVTLLEAAKKFRTIRGFQQIPVLIENMKTFPVDLHAEVA